ncbi:MAG: hypothetical protein IPM06_19520 [Rhizobiales bacterium]|nr:hypothetical protein [Hyphomicrobiales bacterium]
MTDYCTTADLKLAGRLDIAGTEYDTALASIITAMSRWIDRFCKLPENGFAPAADATRYYGDDDVRSSVLRLDAPLASLTSVSNGLGVALTAAQYRLWPRNAEYANQIHLLSGAVWSFAIDGEIAVAGRWGMATAVPPTIKEACVMLSAWTFKRYQAGLADATANVDLGQLVYSEGIPKQVQFLLQGFRWTVI